MNHLEAPTEGTDVSQKHETDGRIETPIRDGQEARKFNENHASACEAGDKRELVGEEIEGRLSSRPKKFTRAANSGVQLTEKDAAVAKAMLAARDALTGQPLYRQSDIASYFCVNAGRIIEIKMGRKFRDVQPAPLVDLPPPGPYVVVPRVSHDQAVRAKLMLDKMLEEVTQLVTRMKRELNREAIANV